MKAVIVIAAERLRIVLSPRNNNNKEICFKLARTKRDFYVYVFDLCVSDDKVINKLIIYVVIYRSLLRYYFFKTCTEFHFFWSSGNSQIKVL